MNCEASILMFSLGEQFSEELESSEFVFTNLSRGESTINWGWGWICFWLFNHFLFFGAEQ